MSQKGSQKWRHYRTNNSSQKKYPAHFYYIDKQVAITYTREPKGTLNINRYIKNLPAWKNNNFISAHKNKTLIITYYLYRGYHSGRIDEIFKEMLDMRFSIYIWHNQELTVLTTEMISEIDTLYETIKNDLHENIKLSACEQLNIPKDQIHVLDEHDLKCLISGEEKSRQIAINNNSRFTEIEFQNLKNAAISLKIIFHQSFSEEANKCVHKFSKTIAVGQGSDEGARPIVPGRP